MATHLDHPFEQVEGDELSSALLKDIDLRVVVVTCRGAAKLTAERHQARAAAAGVLAQGVTMGLLLAALQKEKSRVNLQLECDGPLRGMFVDADNEGNVRGYVKNPMADVEVASAEYRYRPVLGNQGFISVLRDLGGGEYYRSSVELRAMELSADFQRYFEVSDQVETIVKLVVQPKDQEPLATVGGLLVQPLPNGDREAFAALKKELPGRFSEALAAHGSEGAHAVLKALFERPDLEMTARYPVGFACRCSKERILNALAAMGRSDLEDMLQKEAKADVTCDFCATQYVVKREELEQLLTAMKS